MEKHASRNLTRKLYSQSAYCPTDSVKGNLRQLTFLMRENPIMIVIPETHNTAHKLHSWQVYFPTNNVL